MRASLHSGFQGARRQLLENRACTRMMHATGSMSCTQQRSRVVINASRRISPRYRRLSAPDLPSRMRHLHGEKYHRALCPRRHNSLVNAGARDLNALRTCRLHAHLRARAKQPFSRATCSLFQMRRRFPRTRSSTR